MSGGLQLTGKSLFAQAYALRAKILEVEEWLPKASDRVVETHPEVCFKKMNEQSHRLGDDARNDHNMQWPKSVWAVQKLRFTCSSAGVWTLPRPTSTNSPTEPRTRLTHSAQLTACTDSLCHAAFMDESGRGDPTAAGVGAQSPEQKDAFPAPLPPGLYEDLLTPNLAAQMSATLVTHDPGVEALRTAEAGDRLALHLATLIRRAIDGIPETDRVQRGADITRALGERLIAAADRTDLHDDLMADPAEVLRSVNPRHPDGSTHNIAQPLTPVLDTVLLTNPRGEPALSKQLLSEIPSSDRIDLIVAFIRYSGIRPMIDSLRRHVEQGRELRILTTTYTGSTEARALEVLAELGARIRVSYDTSTTRLHAKSWLFHRSSGASTAYIGSSNLTHSAQVAGLEWNVRISGRRNPDVIASTAAVFAGVFCCPNGFTIVGGSLHEVHRNRRPATAWESQGGPLQCAGRRD